MTTKKYPQNLHTQTNIYFSNPPPPKKKIEIQNFEPQTMTPAYLCMKISEYPPPPPLGLALRLVKYTGVKLIGCSIVTEIVLRGSSNKEWDFLHSLKICVYI